MKIPYDRTIYQHSLYDNFIDRTSKMLGGKASYDEVIERTIDIALSAIQDDIRSYGKDELYEYVVDLIRDGQPPFGRDQIKDWLSDQRESLGETEYKTWLEDLFEDLRKEEEWLEAEGLK